MDDVARYNLERWAALVNANALFTRPRLDLDEEGARELVDPDGSFGDLHGKRVLCLAGGGGQQSVAFALLGAEVTVVDLSGDQLERDRKAANHYGLNLTLHQADMRDLSVLESQAFHVVYHPYSLNFVPNAEEVFRQVKHVIKPGGIYDLMCANPFALGIGSRDWNGNGYPVKTAYVQGQRIESDDEEWVYNRDEHGTVPPLVEYRHTLSHLVSALVANGFVIIRLQEIIDVSVDYEAAPGTWGHFTAVLPPWLSIRTIFHPDIFGNVAQS